MISKLHFKSYLLFTACLPFVFLNCGETSRLFSPDPSGSGSSVKTTTKTESQTKSESTKEQKQESSTTDAQKKKEDKPENTASGKSGIHDEEKNNFEENDAWRDSSREGWLNSNKLQALYSTTNTSISKDELTLKARERLAWLLLLKDYRVSREHQKSAEVLAASKLFAGLGREQIFSKKESGRVKVLIVKTGAGLQSEWEGSLPKVEKRFPELKPLRKN